MIFSKNKVLPNSLFLIHPTLSSYHRAEALQNSAVHSSKDGLLLIGTRVTLVYLNLILLAPTCQWVYPPTICIAAWMWNRQTKRRSVERPNERADHITYRQVLVNQRAPSELVSGVCDLFSEKPTRAPLQKWASKRRSRSSHLPLLLFSPWLSNRDAIRHSTCASVTESTRRFWRRRTLQKRRLDRSSARRRRFFFSFERLTRGLSRHYCCSVRRYRRRRVCDASRTAEKKTFLLLFFSRFVVSFCACVFDDKTEGKKYKSFSRGNDELNAL